jgi:hypothetical protein
MATARVPHGRIREWDLWKIYEGNEEVVEEGRRFAAETN